MPLTYKRVKMYRLNVHDLFFDLQTKNCRGVHSQNLESGPNAVNRANPYKKFQNHLHNSTARGSLKMTTLITKSLFCSKKFNFC